MAYLVAMQFLVFFFSHKNVEDFVDDYYKREAVTPLLRLTRLADSNRFRDARLILFIHFLFI